MSRADYNERKEARIDRYEARALKARGFRWSPTTGAWQRQCSEGAWYWALECARAAQ